MGKGKLKKLLNKVAEKFSNMPGPIGNIARAADAVINVEGEDMSNDFAREGSQAPPGNTKEASGSGSGSGSGDGTKEPFYKKKWFKIGAPIAGGLLLILALVKIFKKKKGGYHGR